MNKILKYSYSVTYSEEDECCIARVAEFPSLSAHGDTFDEALNEIVEVVADVVEDLEKNGEKIPLSKGEQETMKKVSGHISKDIILKLLSKELEEEVHSIRPTFKNRYFVDSDDGPFEIKEERLVHWRGNTYSVVEFTGFEWEALKNG